MEYAQEVGKLAAKEASMAGIYAQMPGAAGTLNKAIQVKALDKCIGDASDIAAQLGKAAGFAESILERIGGPSDEAEGSGGDTAEPLGSLSKLNSLQDSSQTRLRRLFRALERIDGLV